MNGYLRRLAGRAVGQTAAIAWRPATRPDVLPWGQGAGRDVVGAPVGAPSPLGGDTALPRAQPPTAETQAAPRPVTAPIQPAARQPPPPATPVAGVERPAAVPAAAAPQPSSPAAPTLAPGSPAGPSQPPARPRRPAPLEVVADDDAGQPALVSRLQPETGPAQAVGPRPRAQAIPGETAIPMESERARSEEARRVPALTPRAPAQARDAAIEPAPPAEARRQLPASSQPEGAPQASAPAVPATEAPPVHVRIGRLEIRGAGSGVAAAPARSGFADLELARRHLDRGLE